MDKLCVLLLCVNVHLTRGIISKGNKFDKCDDCMPISKCKEALPYVDMTDENLKRLSPFFCGVTSSFNVCCSKLKDPKTVEASTRANQRRAKLRLLPDSCGNIYNSFQLRIIAGMFAKIYEYPWMVLICYNTGHGDGLKFKCSGTLINSRYVLTAAHCLHNADINSTRIGEYDIGKDTDCDENVCESNLQDINVQKEIIHENYNHYDNYANDIALLRLENEVDMSYKNTGTICLPVTEELQNRAIFNRFATVAGWGTTEFQKESDSLLKVTVPVRSNEDCEHFYSEKPPSELKKFCAGAYRKDSCTGDSGGPLMIEDSYKGKSRVVQYGIVSSGPIKCGSTVPGMYTDVRQYVDWILDNIEE